MSKRDLAYRSITKTLYDELGCDIASAIPEFRFSDAAGETHLLACNFDSRAFYVDDEILVTDINHSEFKRVQA